MADHAATYRRHHTQAKKRGRRSELGSETPARGSTVQPAAPPNVSAEGRPTPGRVSPERKTLVESLISGEHANSDPNTPEVPRVPEPSRPEEHESQDDPVAPQPGHTADDTNPTPPPPTDVSKALEEAEIEVPGDKPVTGSLSNKSLEESVVEAPPLKAQETTPIVPPRPLREKQSHETPSASHDELYEVSDVPEGRRKLTNDNIRKHLNSKKPSTLETIDESKDQILLRDIDTGESATSYLAPSVADEAGGPHSAAGTSVHSCPVSQTVPSENRPQRPTTPVEKTPAAETGGESVPQEHFPPGQSQPDPVDIPVRPRGAADDYYHDPDRPADTGGDHSPPPAPTIDYGHPSSPDPPAGSDPIPSDLPGNPPSRSPSANSSKGSTCHDCRCRRNRLPAPVSAPSDQGELVPEIPRRGLPEDLRTPQPQLDPAGDPHETPGEEVPPPREHSIQPSSPPSDSPSLGPQRPPPPRRGRHSRHDYDTHHQRAGHEYFHVESLNVTLNYKPKFHGNVITNNNGGGVSSSRHRSRRSRRSHARKEESSDSSFEPSDDGSRQPRPRRSERHRRNSSESHEVHR